MSAEATSKSTKNAEADVKPKTTGLNLLNLSSIFQGSDAREDFQIPVKISPPSLNKVFHHGLNPVMVQQVMKNTLSGIHEKPEAMGIVMLQIPEFS